MPALYDAVAAGDLTRVQSLIIPGTDLDEQDAEGRTALHRAIELGHDDIALELLHSGADPARLFFSTPDDDDDDDGMNALHWAAMLGRTPVVRAILDRGGVDINSMGSYPYPD